ncbi:kelch domain-containing protein 7A [Aegotheles albertisi]
MPQRVTLPWQSDMQLASKLVLSAAALLLLTLAYRFYKSRSLAGGKIPPTDNTARDGDGDEEWEGDGAAGLRRRRGFGGEVRRDDGDGEGSIPGTRHTPAWGDQGLPRGEEEGEEGGEVVSQLGLTYRKAGMARRGSELGSKLGSKSGSELRIELGSEPGSKPGIELGSELGSGLGSKTGSELGSKLASKPGSKPGSEPESKITNKPGREPGNKLGIELGSELGSEQARKTGSKPGNELESDLERKLASKTGSELGNKLAHTPGNKLGIELGSELGSEQARNTGRKPGNELGRNLGKKLASKTGSELENQLAHKPGSKLGIEMGSEPGSELGSKPESEPGNDSGSELGSKLPNKTGSELGSKLPSKPGNEPGTELGSEPGNDLGSDLGSKLASKSGGEQRNKLGSDLGSKPGREPGSEWGSKMASKPGSKQGNELGIELGSNLRSPDPGDVVDTLHSHGEEGALAPGTGLSPGAADAQMADEGCAQSTEQDLFVGGMRQKTKGCRAMVQTLSVTSDLGLMMTANNEASDASYSFSSVAKIQVEENYIVEQWVKDRAGQPLPGLKGKVYDYYIQSISHSVSKKRCLPYIPSGTSRCRSPKRVNEESQGFATQELDPVLATQDPITSSIVPPPPGSLELPPEPPSPGRKDSILQIAESPHLQLPMEGFGVMAPASTPPACPQPGLVASANISQMPPPTHLDLGNCYEVLCMAKAQKLGHLREAAYKVMSDNYLQVLRTPSIYGRLNAGEREHILRKRMKGKAYMAVADISMQEPSLHTSRLCYYNDGGDNWHHLCHVPPEVVSRGCAMCSMFNYLFVVTGCKGTGRMQRPSNRVFCYDPLTSIWKEICPLNQARPHCKLVALDGHLYAIGGECLYTVERYDPRQDRWTFVAPLPHDTFAVAHTATVCDGEIYVTGGTLRYVLLRYTARSNSWRVSLVSGGKDRTVEMVSTNGFIYRFDLHHSTGISVHRCGAKAKLWYECATYAMPDPSSFQCAVVGSLVHCVGRHFHVRFLADHISPRFGTKELQPFPSPSGSLLLAVLVLPEGGTAQTQV